jgi:membrane-associated protease RseP (regulator of RpoE activity)
MEKNMHDIEDKSRASDTANISRESDTANNSRVCDERNGQPKSPKFGLRIALAVALALQVTLALAEPAAATPKSQRSAADVQQEMQVLGKRMAELAQELKALGGSASAYSFQFNTEDPKSSTQIRTFDLPSGPRGPALGVLLEPAANGAKVVGVTPGSGAESAGLKLDDILQAVNGKRIQASDPVAELRKQLSTLSAGSKVQVDYVRGTEKRQTMIELKAMPRVLMLDSQGTSMGMIELPTLSASGKSDVKVEMISRGEAPERITRIIRNAEMMHDLDLIALNPDLARYFGVTNGVLALRVEQLPPLLSGDVITRIAGNVVRTPGDVANALQTTNDEVEVEVVRGSTTRTFKVKVPEAMSLPPPPPPPPPAPPRT